MGYCASIGNAVTLASIVCGMIAFFTSTWVQNPQGNTAGIACGTHINGTDVIWYLNPDNGFGYDKLQSAGVLWLCAWIIGLGVLAFGLATCLFECLCLCCLSNITAWVAAFLAFLSWLFFLVGIMLFSANIAELQVDGSTGNFLCTGAGSFSLGNCTREWGYNIAIATTVLMFFSWFFFVPTIRMRCGESGDRKGNNAYV
eukprot:comp23549_c2_seq4/m.39757 comp23549_c2_seq4/g.39757  ORF comp23549_c2_seq4/g.39757 comp23549_c2_seq4/m.39757 type:complete len:200 (-) comp23549_c2_seq4:1066-1665(-)